jgi:putative transposase
VTRVVKSVVEVTEPDQVWEFDIKYVWIHGESRNAYLLAMIDCYSREVVGHYIVYHCTGNHVKETMMIAFDQRGLESISGIHMRSDNGIQPRMISEDSLGEFNEKWEIFREILGNSKVEDL